MSTVQPITDWRNYISTHATIATATHRLYYSLSCVISHLSARATRCVSGHTWLQCAVGMINGTCGTIESNNGSFSAVEYE